MKNEIVSLSNDYTKVRVHDPSLKCFDKHTIANSMTPIGKTNLDHQQSGSFCFTVEGRYTTLTILRKLKPFQVIKNRFISLTSRSYNSYGWML